MKKMTLKQLLKEALTSDYWKEEAEDFLYKQGISILSHSRNSLYRLAGKTGWRPQKF